LEKTYGFGGTIVEANFKNMCPLAHAQHTEP
jgi:hypothetical protein